MKILTERYLYFSLPSSIDFLDVHFSLDARKNIRNFSECARKSFSIFCNAKCKQTTTLYKTTKIIENHKRINRTVDLPGGPLNKNFHLVSLSFKIRNNSDEVLRLLMYNDITKGQKCWIFVTFPLVFLPKLRS